MPGEDKNDGAIKKEEESNGSTPTTTTTTTTGTVLQGQPFPLPVPGPSSSSGMIIQSTAILGRLGTTVSGVVLPPPMQNNTPSTSYTPTPSTSKTTTGLMSNPIATVQLANAKLNAIRKQLSGRGTITSGATPTPSCNAVSVPQGNRLLKPDVICPSPPDWGKDCAKAIQGGTTYTRSPIDPSSPEYTVISDLVSCINFTKIERIVNVGLWTKFVSARRDSLREKSDDLDLLTGLGLPSKMADMQCQAVKRLKIDPSSSSSSSSSSMPATEYSDNIALLFHGTHGSLEDILAQGLDERLGNSEGLLGRGLYFADNPIKSILYDTHGVLIIFAVYLGDCMTVDHLTSNKSTFVREPKKLDHQKRTQTDLFFDSIVGRPNPQIPTNEFVVFNRFKCCPMYIMSYDKENPIRVPIRKVISYAKVCRKLPPFAWTPKPSTIVVNGGEEVEAWPYFAKVIFDLMRKMKDENDMDLAIKLSLILELGLPAFKDDSVNLTLLRQFNFDLEKTIDYILKHEPTPMEIDDGIEIVYSSIKTNVPPSGGSNSNSPASSEPPSKILLKFQKVGGEWMSVPLNGLNGLNSLPAQSPIRTPLKEDCLICCNEFPPTPTHWVILKCTHKLCTQCHHNVEKEGVTMGGVKHKSVKCPFCQCIDGILIGDCPIRGRMEITIMDIPNRPNPHCEGYEDFGVIDIVYQVSDGKYQVKRRGFLPNSPEGLKVLDLLKIAWDRRLIFTIGTSMTTGQTDVLVWNGIHHKTNLNGGSAHHGYPDPTYLARVTEELKQLGVE